MAPTPKKTPVKGTPKKSPMKSPVKGKTPKSVKKSPVKTPKKSPKVEKAIEKDEKKKRKGKTTKDPNAPKKALSGYMFFINENRESIIQKYGLNRGKVAEVASKAGEVWKGMSEAEKKPYEEKAAKDKERYAKANEAYVPDPSQFIKKKGAKPEKDANAPKRATTGYFFFMGENREKLIAEYKLDKSKVAEVASKAGEVWKGMTDAQKKPYMEKAEADKARYTREMAAYKPA